MMDMMHKVFYASGFLYHSPTQQILLQQVTINELISYSLFYGKSQPGEEASAAFKRIILEELGINLKPTAINPIYDYFYKETSKNHFLIYAEVPTVTLKLKGPKKSAVEWLPLKKLSKLNVSEQMRHDIIVGQRVIQANKLEQDQKSGINLQM